MIIHARSEWTRETFEKTPTVPWASRTEYMIHYEGGTPTTDTGAAAMRHIHQIHLDNGWSGIGYNFVIFQDGSIWEGRGWDKVGAHCKNHNAAGWGVQVHVGGSQQPSAAALASAAWLYGEACRRARKPLQKLGHRDGFATDCPGTQLYSWVKSGMPAPPPATPPIPPVGDEMFFQAESASTALNTDGTPVVGVNAVYACSVNTHWHVPGPAASLVAAHLAVGGKLPRVSGDALLAAFPHDAANPGTVTTPGGVFDPDLFAAKVADLIAAKVADLIAARMKD